MKSKVSIFIIVGVVLSLFLVGSVIAMTQHEQETYNKIDFFWGKLKYAIEKGLFLFTSWGQKNDCSVYPDDIEWTYGTERVDCDDGGCSYDKCAIDSWSQRICLGGKCSKPSSPSYSNYEGEENGVGASFRGSTSNQWYFSEIYCCPKDVPEIEDHDTKAYKCEDGSWDYKGRYDSNEYCKHAGSGNDYECWCRDEDDNFYIDESGGVHCQESDYSRVTDGTWCAAFEEHASYTCYNNDIWWYDDNNNRNDKKEDCGSLGCVSGGEECKSEPEDCHVGSVGSISYCTSSCKCGEGEGDCDGLGTDKQCKSGLICVSNVGPNYGFGSSVDVCEKPNGNGCTSHASKKCYNNDVYWYDSCGNRETKYKDCGTAGCSGGVCNVVTVTCQSNADTNNDGEVDRNELGVYINKWINGQITRTKLGQSIMEWVDGC